MAENKKPSPADREEELAPTSERDADKARKGEVGEGAARIKDEHKDKDDK